MSGPANQPAWSVGNDFLPPQKSRPVRISVEEEPILLPIGAQPIIAAPLLDEPAEIVIPEPATVLPMAAATLPAVDPMNLAAALTRFRVPKVAQRALDLVHTYTVATFAVSILIISSIGLKVYSDFAAAHSFSEANASSVLSITHHTPIAGLNKSLPTTAVAATEKRIDAQAITVSFDGKTAATTPTMVQSWLRTTTSSDGTRTSIHADSSAIAASLKTLAKPYTKTAVNEVIADHGDGVKQTIVTGVNGVSIADVNAAANQIAKNVLSGNGMNIIAPLKTTPYQSVTPAAFPKLLEADVTTKRMYAYENGKLVRTFLVSAGAPATPTPLGEFHIYEKLPVQDMSGYNENGTKYFQPHVRWINYFLPGGFAVHGNYWRPLSWFGNINSSHGCVSLPDNQAEWIYNWAPIGTTVITHA